MGSTTTAIASSLSLSDLDDVTITLNGSNKVAIKDGGVGNAQLAGGGIDSDNMQEDNQVLTVLTAGGTLVDPSFGIGLAPTTLTFTDSVGSDNASISQTLPTYNWSSANGTPTIKDFQMTFGADNDAVEASYTGTLAQFDATVVMPDVTASSGVLGLFIYSDGATGASFPANALWIEYYAWTGGNVILKKRVASSDTVLVNAGGYATTAGTEVDLTVTKSGSDYEFFIDDVSIGTASDAFSVTESEARIVRTDNSRSYTVKKWQVQE